MTFLRKCFQVATCLVSYVSKAYKGRITQEKKTSAHANVTGIHEYATFSRSFMDCTASKYTLPIIISERSMGKSMIHTNHTRTKQAANSESTTPPLYFHFQLSETIPRSIASTRRPTFTSQHRSDHEFTTR
jgi:hypothetical protein